MQGGETAYAVWPIRLRRQVYSNCGDLYTYSVSRLRRSFAIVAEVAIFNARNDHK
jgi:hypothetical protein